MCGLEIANNSCSHATDCTISPDKSHDFNRFCAFVKTSNKQAYKNISNLHHIICTKHGYKPKIVAW